jgi:hypothetical protein
VTLCDRFTSSKLLTPAKEQFQKIEQQHFNGWSFLKITANLLFSQCGHGICRYTFNDPTQKGNGG